MLKTGGHEMFGCFFSVEFKFSIHNYLHIYLWVICILISPNLCGVPAYDIDDILILYVIEIDT